MLQTLCPSGPVILEELYSGRISGRWGVDDTFQSHRVSPLEQACSGVTSTLRPRKTASQWLVAMVNDVGKSTPSLDLQNSLLKELWNIFGRFFFTGAPLWLGLIML